MAKHGKAKGAAAKTASEPMTTAVSAIRTAPDGGVGVQVEPHGAGEPGGHLHGGAEERTPSGDVVISATSGATATVSPATLTFTGSDWSTPKTVTVTGRGHDRGRVAAVPRPASSGSSLQQNWPTASRSITIASP